MKIGTMHSLTKYVKQAKFFPEEGGYWVEYNKVMKTDLYFTKREALAALEEEKSWMLEYFQIREFKDGFEASGKYVGDGYILQVEDESNWKSLDEPTPIYE